MAVNQNTSFRKCFFNEAVVYKAVSIGSYTLLHLSLPGLEASPAVFFFLSTLSSYAVFSLYLAQQIEGFSGSLFHFHKKFDIYMRLNKLLFIKHGVIIYKKLLLSTLSA